MEILTWTWETNRHSYPTLQTRRNWSWKKISWARRSQISMKKACIIINHHHRYFHILILNSYPGQVEFRFLCHILEL